MKIESMETAPRDGRLLWLFDGRWRVGSYQGWDKPWEWRVFEPGETEGVDGWTDEPGKGPSLWGELHEPPQP